MEIALETPREHLTVLRVKGHIDASTSAQLERSVQAALEGERKACVLNLSGVDYLSSAGIRVLMIGAKQANATGGAFILCAVRPPVAGILGMVGLGPLFQAFEEEESAVRAAEKICVA
jgi:anti-sigma B factor antagonist